MSKVSLQYDKGLRSGGLLFDQIRQDAFLLEIANYDLPWPPELDDFKEPFEFFRDGVFKNVPGTGYCALALEVHKMSEWSPGTIPKLVAYAFNPHEVKYVFFGSDLEVQARVPEGYYEIVDTRLPAIEWLVAEINMGRASATKLGRSISDWAFNKSRMPPIVVPYITRHCDLIKNLREEDRLSLRQIYKRIQDDGLAEEFLETVSTPLEKNTVFNLKSAYFSSAWILGIDSLETQDPTSREDIEGASMLFQLSWGYPQLVKERARQALHAAELKAEKEKIIRRDSALKRFKNVFNEIGKIHDEGKRIIDDLQPKSEDLEFRYRIDSLYFKTTGSNFDRWYFRHWWSFPLKADDPAKDSRHFRAQFSLILLAFKSPPGFDPSNSDKPWEDLQRHSEDLHKIYAFLFGNTFTKLFCADATWDQSDEEAFNIFRGCFNEPFKNPENLKLTGPLLVLWLAQIRGIESFRDDFYQGLIQEEKHVRGKNWPGFDFLCGIHDFHDDLKAKNENCRLSLEINPTFGVEQSTKIVFHFDEISGVPEIRSLYEERLRNPLDPLVLGTDEARSSLRAAFMKIVKYKTSHNTDFDFSQDDKISLFFTIA